MNEDKSNEEFSNKNNELNIQTGKQMSQAEAIMQISKIMSKKSQRKKMS